MSGLVLTTRVLARDGHPLHATKNASKPRPPDAELKIRPYIPRIIKLLSS